MPRTRGIRTNSGIGTKDVVPSVTVTAPVQEIRCPFAPSLLVGDVLRAWFAELEKDIPDPWKWF